MEEKERAKETDTGTPQVNPGYALFQIAKALTTSEHHEEPATRERAQQKMSKWVTVLSGILNGTLDVGSRTPLEGVPGWATLEVVAGGFATGELLAGGPLLNHERRLLSELSPTSGSKARRVLNGYYLTDDGLASLREMLCSACYDVTVPEEGALLVVAWLVRDGYAEEARSLLDKIGPYFPKLRFYPAPSKHPRRFGSRVFLQDVQCTIDSLRKIGPDERILAQKEATQVWAPLYDRIVGLFIETVDGDSPNLRCGRDGKRPPIQNGRFPVEGGWPCQKYPEDWRVRAQEALDEYKRSRRTHKLCGRPDRAKDSFAQLREYLRRCVKKPESLSGRDVGRIRLLLARYVSKRGTPDSPRCRDIREQQFRQVSAPTFQEIAEVVIPRLEAGPKDGGLDDISPVVQPVGPEEGRRWKIEEGTTVPDSLQRKVQRCLSDTVEVLVERGIVTSGETLARVLPQMTSGLKAAGIADPTLRQLYAAIYRAFRRRRSLLLQNLEKQIQIEELPWVAAVDRFRRDDLSARELAKQALEEVTVLTSSSFPHVILPNKLLQELRALAKTAEMDLPLVDEVAADIFMGEFSGKFLRAAKTAAGLLEGTLYVTYYEIDYRQVRQMPEAKKGPKKPWFHRNTSDPFVELCSSRAGVSYGSWDPVINGMIIEQQQILTSQNLAVLFDGLGLVDALRNRLDDLPRRCFSWICRRQQVQADKFHAKLIMLKNTAYAWRQMVFFLALLPDAEVQAFLSWANEHLNKQKEGFRNRFRPALAGLTLAAEGRSIDDEEVSRSGARRFLGWSKKKHWLCG